MFEGINESAVAARFAALVREYVGESNFATIKARNASGSMPAGCCASHDFCDSNVFLLEALSEAAPEFAARWNADQTDSESMMTELAPVWNRIHAIATTQHFTKG